jgi:hypothetical protein
MSKFMILAAPTDLVAPCSKNSSIYGNLWEDRVRIF